MEQVSYYHVGAIVVVVVDAVVLFVVVCSLVKTSHKDFTRGKYVEERSDGDVIHVYGVSTYIICVVCIGHITCSSRSD